MAEPTNVTITHAPEGFNCSLSVSGYGSRVVRATDISHGVDIATSQDDTRDNSTLYTLNVTETPFVVTCIFKSMAERDAFADWLRGWAHAVSANRPVGGFITVRCPARRFVRTAVWESGITYGDAIGTFAYPLSLQFRAAEDPTSAIGATDVAGDSSVQAASRDTANAPYFYPSYYVNGASGDAPIYDRPAAQPADTNMVAKAVTTGPDPIYKLVNGGSG